jgi:hypothetical protein
VAVPGHPTSRRNSVESGKRREKFIKLRSSGMSIVECCEAIEVKPSTYNFWRHRWPEFAARADEGFRRSRHAPKLYDGSFVSFRQHYLGMETTWFQQLVVEAIEHARPGEVVLVLMPPAHGKTTLLEDWCTYKLVSDNSFRITVGSETVDHGVKVVSRVRDRFEEDGPTPTVVRDFGPLAPESKDSSVWSQRRFNVVGKMTSDERDYSMNCVGITGRVQGTRCDLLLLDDMQDIKSIDQSQKYYNIVTQSFLSRPDMFGRTVIIGTRVGEFDVYRHLIDAQVADKIIRIPAYKIDGTLAWPQPQDKPLQDKPETWAPQGLQFLWPDKYDQIEEGGASMPGLHRFRYAALRFRVGEQTWHRIYMQRPEAATSMTFDEKTTAFMWDETRSIIADPRVIDSSERRDSTVVGETNKCPVIVAVDPAVGGGNGVLAAAARPRKLEVLHCQLDYGLSKFAQIIDLIEEECHRFSTPTSVVTTVVIEDKAFQRGLLQDDRMLELQRRFGFRIVPNTTGREKVDPDIGVPSMPMAMIRNEITIPWADEVSQDNMAPLLDHLHMWRPGVDGVKLPQDLVMCLWFAYRQWRGVRDTPLHAQPDLDRWRTASSTLRHRPLRTTRRHRPYRVLGGGH